MPTGTTCFSNPADLPPVIGNRDAVQSAQSGWLNCFSYPAGRCSPGYQDPQRRPVGPVRPAQLLQLFQLTSRRVTVLSLIWATRS